MRSKREKWDCWVYVDFKLLILVLGLGLICYFATGCGGSQKQVELPADYFRTCYTYDKIAQTRVEKAKSERENILKAMSKDDGSKRFALIGHTATQAEYAMNDIDLLLDEAADTGGSAILDRKIVAKMKELDKHMSQLRCYYAGTNMAVCATLME